MNYDRPAGHWGGISKWTQTASVEAVEHTLNRLTYINRCGSCGVVLRGVWETRTDLPPAVCSRCAR